MKILNQTTRDSYSTIQKTPVSSLQPTTELDEDSLIHIVQKVPGTTPSKFESMKMDIKTFQNKMYEAIQNTFKTEYWDTHCDKTKTTHTQNVEKDPYGSAFPKGTSFYEFIQYLGPYNASTNNVIWQPTQKEYEAMSFIDHVYYDFDVVKRYIVKKDNDLQSQINVNKTNIIEVSSMFSTNMKIWTTNNSGAAVEKSTTSTTTVDDTYCQMEIKPGNKISNTWTVPASGNLVAYGWLDSSEALNNRAIPSSFCVLEANINPMSNAAGTENIDNWEIIAVQQVIPFKTKTYVGFNVPVRKGLIIRVRTGFTCGAKSIQNSNEQDGSDTLANSTANGFRCQVFCHKDYTR